MDKHSAKTKSGKTGIVILIVLLAAALLAGLVFAVWFLTSRPLGPRQTPEPAATAAPTPAPSPTPEPAPVCYGGYFRCDDGLFYPESPLTLDGLAAALSAATGERAAFVGDGDEVLTDGTLTARLEEYYDAGRVAAAMGSAARRGDDTVTRAEAAVILNALLGLREPSGDDFPDVEPGYWARDAILTAAVSGTVWPAGPLPEPGFLWRDGYLYCVGEDGYFLKNRYLGSLYFTSSGRYTSGSLELDGYVAAAIDANTDESMSRDERLYAMYVYVRDSFKYLRRHYYHVGDVGWALEESLTMYATGQGNCYCYSSAFWAAARGLGYDAKIVSGTYGDEKAPHGWVEIYTDGGRLTYDVEIEMVSRRDGNKKQDLFAMDESRRRGHGYIELVASDNLAPRETNEGLLPG
ncbi:MAG: transglutaminase domain-containing protein [Oscillospiraceae bacterium]|nr:transglutaminase domain-containing protein [Oscillospiraceae bacterium]